MIVTNQKHTVDIVSLLKNENTSRGVNAHLKGSTILDENIHAIYLYIGHYVLFNND